MFNPTIIRTCTFGARTGVVISPSLDGDHYFQVYVNRPNDHTELEITIPFASQVRALNHFESWAQHMDTYGA